VHHYVSSTTFLLGSGAELRGQMTREPLAWPLALVVDGKSLLSSKARLTNIQLISTAGIAPADLAHCLECAHLPRQSALSEQKQNEVVKRLCCLLSSCVASSILCYQCCWKCYQWVPSDRGAAAMPEAEQADSVMSAACDLSMLLSLSMRCVGPCKDIPDRGGFACCRDESCHTQTPGPPRTYRFEYNVTFRYGAVPFPS